MRTNNPDFCRMKADECRSEAQKSADAERVATWLKLAEGWDKLAVEVEAERKQLIKRASQVA